MVGRLLFVHGSGSQNLGPQPFGFDEVKELAGWSWVYTS